MRETLAAFRLLIFSLIAGLACAQSVSKSHAVPLCDLQTKLERGEHRYVQVEGVYLSGLEGQYLVASHCSGRSTFIEFKLTTNRLWNQLLRMSNQTNRQKHVSGDGDPILVVFEGEFLGPLTCSR
jgi:hypothetical protein